MGGWVNYFWIIMHFIHHKLGKLKKEIRTFMKDNQDHSYQNTAYWSNASLNDWMVEFISNVASDTVSQDGG